MAKTDFKTMDEYIKNFPEHIQEKLEKVRQTISNAAPDAKEAINYQMPTFKLHGNLVHFAAHEHHIGFYPTPSAINAFKQELSAFTTSKGAVQFPNNKPIPYDLISKMVNFRVNEVEKA